MRYTKSFCPCLKRFYINVIWSENCRRNKCIAQKLNRFHAVYLHTNASASTPGSLRTFINQCCIDPGQEVSDASWGKRVYTCRDSSKSQRLSQKYSLWICFCLPIPSVFSYAFQLTVFGSLCTDWQLEHVRFNKGKTWKMRNLGSDFFYSFRCIELLRFVLISCVIKDMAI